MPEVNRQTIMQAFSQRLIALLKQRGYASSAAVSGVKIKVLAEQLGCSVQIARRYTLGESLPEPEQLVKIAQWLGVSSGWLLFGEGEQAMLPAAVPDADLIKYILQRTAPLYLQSADHGEVVEFVHDLIYDALHLKANKKTIYKMIDMSIQSAQRFNNKKKSTVA